MNAITRKRLAKRKAKIRRRLRPIRWTAQPRPMLAAANIRYELADRVGGIACGGIGLMHLMARRTGLVEALDANLHLLKAHLPYHESDHVLNIAYNILVGGTCLEDLELRRNDVHYLDALGAQRIPDPTTAGDFCRRFRAEDIERLMQTINQVRLQVWHRQSQSFFEEAVLDADGVIAATDGQCKEGMGLSYDGRWGYHPLVLSLANTGEPLFLVNRGGNRPSNEGAAERFDQALALVRGAGFRKVLFRGDTDFSQTTHLDRWDEAGVRFIFGMDAKSNLVGIADGLGAKQWKPLPRRVPRPVLTAPRARPENVRQRIVRERGYRNHRLESEQVAWFAYRPWRCKRSYRMVVVRKNLSVERGERALFDEVRYFFYITNDRRSSDDEIVRLANQRCDQENLNEQLRNGVRALRMPLDNLLSNWAYMVMASLAWTLKAWTALLLPRQGRWKDREQAEAHALLRMEFKTFRHALVELPCQIVRTSRRIVYRLLSWNPWQHVFLRAVEALRLPMRC